MKVYGHTSDVLHHPLTQTQVKRGQVWRCKLIEMSPQPIQNLNQLKIQMSTQTPETASLISTSKGRPLVNFRERQFEEDACFFKGIRYHQTEPVSYQESCHLHDFTSENLSLSSLKEVQTKRLQRQLKMFQVKVEIRSRDCNVSTTYIGMIGQYRPPREQRTYQ